MTENFPGNSRRANQLPPGKPAPAESGEQKTPKLEPIVTGRVVHRKKGWGRKILGTIFVGEGGILSHLGKEIFIPAAQALVADVVAQVTDSVRQGVEVAIWGQPRGPLRGPGVRPGMIQRTNYNNPTTIISRSSPLVQQQPPMRRPQVQASALDMEEIVLGTEFEAQMMCEKLYETIQDYGTASVANVREALRESPLPTDYNWGWRDGAEFRYRRVRDGWRVDFSPVEDIRK